LLALLMLCGAVAAQPLPPPQVSHSPDPPIAGDVLVYEIALENPRDQPITPQLSLSWPEQAYPVGFSGLADGELDHESGELRGTLTLAPGAREVVELQVLTSEAALGTRVSLRARLYETWSETDQWENHTVELDRRPDASGVAVGALRVLPAGLAALGWVLATGLVGLALLVLSTRRGASAPRVPGGVAGVTLALMVPVAFWMIFASMAWRDWRILTAWQPCEATVLGGRLIEAAASDSDARRRTTGSTRFRPELALRYEVDGITYHSTGFDSGSALRSGGRAGGDEALATWRAGARVPCWVNPEQPRDVVIARGFGGAYLFALLPLPVFGMGLLLLRRLRQRSA